MFIPQRYMTLTVGKDRVVLNKKLFDVIEDSCETLSHNANHVALLSFLEKYRNSMGILIENDKRCIELFQDLIDDGEPVPGYVMMFESHIFFLLTDRTLPNGIKRIGSDVSPEPISEDNIIKLPDIRKLLERV